MAYNDRYVDFNGVRLGLEGIQMDATQSTDPTVDGEIKYVDGTGFRFSQEGVVYTFQTSTGGGVSGSLDSAYSIGTNISVDEGSITLTDATTGALNTLELVRTGAGSGNMADFAVDAALTGNVLDIDMNLGLGAKAIYIDGGNGIRTVDLIDVKHDGSGNVDVFNITSTNTGTGAIFDINMNGNGSDAGVINVDMDLAVDAEFLVLDAGAQTRSVNLFEITNDGAGNVDLFAITDSNTGSGALFDIDMSGNGGGSVFDVDMDAALDEEFLILDAGAKTRTADLFSITNDGAGNMDLFAIVDSNTGSGALFDINMDGDGGGSVFDVDMNAALGEEFLILDAGSQTRTVNLFEITFDGAGNTDLFAVADSCTGSGSLFDIDCTGATATGAVINCDLDTAVAKPFLTVDYGDGTRTEDVFQLKFDGDGDAPVWDIDITNTGAGTTAHLWDVTVDSVFTANVLSVVYGTAAATGDCVVVDMGTAVGASALNIAAAGARTDDLIKIDDASTSNAPIFDINLTAAHTGGVFDVKSSHANATGNVVNIDLDASLGMSAIFLDAGGGTNTVDMFLATLDGDGDVGFLDVTVTNTGAGNIIELDIDSVHTGNAFLVNYGTGAATGDCVSLTMGTNVAGRAVMISSAATGISGEGAAIDITHTGDLAAGADVMNITSSGNISSTSNLLALEQATGAGTAGANCLYINATGTNVEAIKVDAGTVTFDETLTVTGATTLSSTLGVTGLTTLTTFKYKDLTEVVAATNTIGADETGSVFFLNHATEFASTLPAPAAGLHFTFIVTGAPVGASYTVGTNAAATIIHGSVASAEDAAGSCDGTNGTAVATITFTASKAVVGDYVEVWSDGSSWICRGLSFVQDAITFT